MFVDHKKQDHAVAEYVKALNGEISSDRRAVVTTQYDQVRAAQDEIRPLRASVG